MLKKRFFFLSTSECVQHYQQSEYLNDKDITLICTSREAMILCETIGISYNIPEDYYNLNELTYLTRKAYDSLQSYCENMDHRYHAKIIELYLNGILPFRFSYYYLKILYDTIAVKIYFIDSFLKLHNNCCIYYYNIDSEMDSYLNEKMLFREHDNIYSLILSKYSNLFHVDKSTFIGIKRKCIPKEQFFPCKMLIYRNYVKLHSFFLKKYFYIKKSIKLLLNSIINKYRINNCRYKLFFCPDMGHDIQFILTPLNEKGIYQYYYRLPCRSRKYNLLFINKLNDIFISELDFGIIKVFFSISCINFFSIVKEQLRYLLTLGIISAIDEYARIETIIKNNPNKFLWSLVGSVNGLGISIRSGLLAAQNDGIKLITYQEGGGYGQDVSPICDYGEMKDGDILLCYGEGNKNYYDKLYYQTKQIVPVGSALQDNVFVRCSKRSPSYKINKIMYIFNKNIGTCMHVPNNSALTDTHYCHRIFEIHNKLHLLHDQIQIILKPNPNDIFLADFFRTKSFFAVETKQLEDCLDDIDLFIIDYPSTTLLTCLNTNAHIFLLEETGCVEFTDDQRAMLLDRVHVYHDIDTLFDALKSFMAFQSPLLNGSAYRKNFSLYLEDGRSCNRAVSFLVNLN